MKPFNLEEYLKNPNREVVTRDGRLAEIKSIDKSLPRFPILASITDKFGNKHFTKYMTNGRVSVELESIHDLFFAPIKHTDYINLYRNEFSYFLGCGEYSTEEEAKKVAARAGVTYITTIKAEWEE